MIWVAPYYTIFGVIVYRYCAFLTARWLADPTMRLGEKLIKERQAND